LIVQSNGRRQDIVKEERFANENHIMQWLLVKLDAEFSGQQPSETGPLDQARAIASRLCPNGGRINDDSSE